MALSLGAAIWAYLSLKKSKRPVTEAISLLPANCSVYLCTGDFFELSKRINSQSLIFDKLRLFAPVEKLCRTLQVADSLLRSNEDLQDELANNPLHFALYGNGDWLLTFNLKQLGNNSTILEGLVKSFSARNVKNDLYQFVLKPEQNFFFNIRDGIVLLSGNDDLVERARDKDVSKLSDEATFSQFKDQLDENNLLSVFVNHGLYANQKGKKMLGLSLACRNGYSAGAMEIQPSELKINGYFLPDSGEVLAALTNQQPCSPSDVTRILPSNTVYFKAFGFSDFSMMSKKLKARFVKNDRDFWKLVNSKALYALDAAFYSNAGQFLTEFENFGGDRFVVLNVADSVQALEHLALMSDTFTLAGNRRIYRIATGKKDLTLFGPFARINFYCAAVQEGQLYFAENEQALISLLDDLASGSLLGKNESFMTYKAQHFPDEFNFLVYVAPTKARDKVKKFWDLKLPPVTDPYDNFKHFSYSITNDARTFKFRLHFNNEADARSREQNVLWTLTLDTTAKMPVARFVNHNSKENEILVQDENNTLYLLNAKGSILWKKKINESVSSRIYVVDSYKNDKYQMLFSSKNYLHLLDRNGSYVEGYPVKLIAETTSPLAVFDYENNKDYRIFIACSNKVIYNYDIKGNKQEGFEPVKTEHPVNLPVQYVKAGELHYIVAVDNEGKIYGFSRKGQNRLVLKNRTVSGCTAFYVDGGNSNNSTSLVYLDDKNGLISKISFTDRKDIVKLSAETENAMVNFCLIDDNRSMDMVITKNRQLIACTFAGNILFEKQADANLTQASYSGDESHGIYYALSEENKTLYLFDQLKQKNKSFEASAMPLVTDLFKDNKKYMIITKDRQLNCVLLN